MVTLLDSTRLPLFSWMFTDVYPVNWSVSDLHAEKNEVAIEHLELAYKRIQTVSL